MSFTVNRMTVVSAESSPLTLDCRVDCTHYHPELPFQHLLMVGTAGFVHGTQRSLTSERLGKLRPSLRVLQGGTGVNMITDGALKKGIRHLVTQFTLVMVEARAESGPCCLRDFNTGAIYRLRAG